MSTSQQRGALTKSTLVAIIVPLFVTVAGGLLVEYLKPREVYVNHAADATTFPTKASVEPSEQLRTLAMTKILTKRWHTSEKPLVHGDLEVEFTPQGQVIRTYYIRIYGTDVKSYPYKITPDGEVSAGDANLKLLKLTDDELVLSWDGTIVDYKRGWYLWEIGLIFGGVVLFIVLMVIIKISRSA